MKTRALLLTVAVTGLAAGVVYAQTQKADKIEVSDASYGLNCRSDQAGNATQYLKEACDGKKTCSFAVSKAASKIGDHCPGQKKEFDYTYLCGDREKKGKVEAEAVGKTAFLTCAE